LIGLASLPLAVPPLRTMSSRTDGPSLNRALAETGVLLGAFSLLVSIGLLLAS
jgi:1,4-dihydroxy-2-naphthoate octaprenyltransferase